MVVGVGGRRVTKREKVSGGPADSRTLFTG